MPSKPRPLPVIIRGSDVASRRYGRHTRYVIVPSLRSETLRFPEFPGDFPVTRHVKTGFVEGEGLRAMLVQKLQYVMK